MQKKLALFFSDGIGLCNWEKKGLLSREIALYAMLVKKGWAIEFYTYDRTTNLPDLGFSVSVVPQWPFITPRRLNFIYEVALPLLRFSRGKTSTVLMTNQAYRGWPAIIASRIWRKKVVARCGMVYGERAEKTNDVGLWVAWRKWLEKFTFRNADLCLVPTRPLAQWLETNYGVNPVKIEVDPKFVDTDLFRPLGNSKRRLDILVIGRLEKVKRHKLLLEADKGWSLQFIGQGSMADELIDYAKRHSINLESVQTVPNVDLPIYLSNAKIFVLLSEWEGHPKALLEAMACGCACIGADAPGIRNVIEHGVNGLLVKPEVDSLARTIELLLNDVHLRRKLGEEARAFVCHNFSLSNISGKYHLLLENESEF